MNYTYVTPTIPTEILTDWLNDAYRNEGSTSIPNTTLITMIREILLSREEEEEENVPIQ